MKVYHDIFEDAKTVIDNFTAPADALDNATVFHAEYSYEDYSGSALVIFEKDGKLFEVNGGHCSCYGLEGQWEPEETSWAAIALRSDPKLKELAAEHTEVKQ